MRTIINPKVNGTQYRILGNDGKITFTGDVDFNAADTENHFGRQTNEVSGPSFRFTDAEALRIFALNLLRAADQLDGIGVQSNQCVRSERKAETCLTHYGLFLAGFQKCEKHN